MGLSAGAGVVISQYFGAQKGDEMSKAVHASMALTALLSLIFTVLGLAFTRPLLVAIGVPEDVLPHSSLYLMIYFTGITFSLFYNMGAGVLRAVGDSTHPLIYLAAACMVNVVLDFLFVCGFHMGIAGAAIATVIAQGVSCVMVMGKLMRAKADYRVEIRRIRFHKKMIRRIISFGFPAALQQSITSFSNVVVQSYINHFGTAAMAGYSATLRIDGFTQLPLQSFNMAITTFVGQNNRRKEIRPSEEGRVCRLAHELRSHPCLLRLHVFICPLPYQRLYKGCGCNRHRKRYGAHFCLALHRPSCGADFKRRPARGRPLQNPHVLHAGKFCGAAPDLPDDRGSSDGQRERGDGGLAPHVGDLRGRHGLVLL